MPKAAKKDPTKKNGSSSPKAKDGNAVEVDPADAEKVVSIAAGTAGGSTDSSATSTEKKKRRGKAPTEGEPLKRVLIFLSESDVTALKAEVGDRGMSTRIREILKEYLAKRG